MTELIPRQAIGVASHLWGTTEGVGVEDGLDHHQRLSHVFSVELVAVVRTLVWTVVENLEELRASKMEHELEREKERERERSKFCPIFHSPDSQTWG